MRAPRDAEILVAIVAGQIAANNYDFPDTVESAIDTAEQIVAEVLRRGDERADV